MRETQFNKILWFYILHKQNKKKSTTLNNKDQYVVEWLKYTKRQGLTLTSLTKKHFCLCINITLSYNCKFIKI